MSGSLGSGPANRGDVLAVSGLRSGYGDIVAIRDVSFEVARGSVLGLLGRNGAGKTTTLRAISGLNRVSAGAIMLDGHDVTGLPVHSRTARGIALVPEGKRIFRLRTVEENLVLGAYCRRLSRRKVHERIEQQYELFPALGTRRSAVAGALSGGQQQMLAIAQALMSEPRVLLLDEPSAGLAPVILHEVLGILARLRDEGMSIVLVEQSIDVVLSVAQRVIVLEFGRVAVTATKGDENLRATIEAAYLSLRRQSNQVVP